MLNKKLYFTFSTLNNSIEEFVIGGQIAIGERQTLTLGMQ